MTTATSRKIKKIGLCSDHAGFELKTIIEGYLISQGVSYMDFGTDNDQSCDYPDYAHPLAAAIEGGICYPGIAICGTGNGIAMTLNKHQAYVQLSAGLPNWRLSPVSTMMLTYWCFPAVLSTRPRLSQSSIHSCRHRLTVAAMRHASLKSPSSRRLLPADRR